MKYIVTLNGKKYEVEVEKVGGAAKSLSRQPVERSSRRETVKQVQEPVANTVAEVKSEAPKSSNSSLVEVLSPMPGVILDVKVKVGDSVKAGQCLAVLEAMKMENDIPASQDGVVEEIRVKQGDTVETDAVLVVLK